LKNHQDIIDDMNYRINKITDTVFPNNDKKKIQRTESNLKNQKYRRSERLRKKLRINYNELSD